MEQKEEEHIKRCVDELASQKAAIVHTTVASEDNEVYRALKEKVDRETEVSRRKICQGSLAGQTLSGGGVGGGVCEGTLIYSRMKYLGLCYLYCYRWHVTGLREYSDVNCSNFVRSV